MDSYSFKVRGGETNAQGKNSWPDLLNVSMSRRDALDLLVTLANQLNRPEEVEIMVSWVGQMAQVEE